MYYACIYLACVLHVLLISFSSIKLIALMYYVTDKAEKKTSRCAYNRLYNEVCRNSRQIPKVPGK
jgi:hypothetical protein